MSTETEHPCNLIVSDVMSSPVHTVHMDDSLSTVKAVLDRHGCHHVVVLDRGRVFGIVSDRDILRSVSPFVGNEIMERRQDSGTVARRVHQIMTREPVTIDPGVPVAVAAHTMLDSRVSSLPVVNQDGILVGILTSRDILRWSVAACPIPVSTCEK